MAGNADLITATENALRELIALVLQSALGNEWLNDSGVTPERMTIWEQRRIEESKRRSLVLEKSLIYFADLPDLRVIVLKHWPSFAGIVGSRKGFEVDMARLEPIRIAVAHGRELSPIEKLDLTAISSRIRTVVTAHRNRNVPDGREYFPRFELLHDSFGTLATGGPSESGRFLDPQTILRPGDQVIFTARGYDPEGVIFRTYWGISSGSVIQAATVPFANSVQWDVTSDHIGEAVHVSFALISNRAQHRYGDLDDNVIFTYSVLPR